MPLRGQIGDSCYGDGHFLVGMSVIILVFAIQWLGGNFWAVLNWLGGLLALPLGFLGEGIGMKPFPALPLKWVLPSLMLTAVLATKYIIDLLYDEFRCSRGNLLIPKPAYLRTWLFIALIAFGGLFIWSLHLVPGWRWIIAQITLGITFLFGIGRYIWEYKNDQKRLSLLRREWIEWHDGMAFLRFHLETWREATNLYPLLLKEAQTLKQDLQKWRATLQETAKERSQLAEDELHSLERAKGRKFPYYIMTKTPQELYEDFLREAGPDLEGDLIRECGERLWKERSSQAVEQAISSFIEGKMEGFWRRRGIVQLLGPKPDISWMLEPAFPFWNCVHLKAPHKAYLGLPPTLDSKYYEERISAKFGLIDPTTGRFMLPVLFEGDPWTIIALYYRYGVSLDKLGSLSEWKKRYEDELRHLEEVAQPSALEEE